ncbi:MAG: hypothetical protein ACMVP2_21120 [Imperialibacter sp.]|uniref:hypothetical protein n=1 Tax=Imperialibacter sp. TaxID=2038411 RepID=UPI003A86B9D9
MEKQKYLDDLQEIKSIMDRSSRFISLSGMSGIVAGFLGLIGAYVAYEMVYSGQDYLGYRQALLSNENISQLLIIAVALLLSAVGAGLFFTQRKASKNNQKLWDSQARRLLINLFIPLAAGGILCVILLFKGLIGLLAPLTLLFYGLALVNASKYTLSEVRSLGLMQVALGLLACQFIGYGLLFWAVGFGLLHIIYGIVMHVKYGS